METLDKKIDVLCKAFQNGKIPIITDDTRFWMVRSKKGFFYNEFVNKEYIAVGWNCITEKTPLSDENLDVLIKQSHPYVKQCTKVKNKCNFIINEMKKNDIVILPNKGMSEITIALVGEYYEDVTKTVEIENEFAAKIETSAKDLIDTDCPYIKRRKIAVLRSISTEKINYHLYQTLRNYNGVDDIDEKANMILGLLYNVFIYKETLYISLEVTQKQDIALSDISGLLYGSSRYFEEAVDRKDVTVKINVSSQGGIDLALIKGIEIVEKYGPGAIITFIAIILIGYLATKIDFPKLIRDIYCIPTYCRQEKIKEEIAKIDLEIKKADLEEKRQKNDMSLKRTPKEFAAQLLSTTSEPLNINIKKLSDEKIHELSRIEKNNGKLEP